MLEAARHPGLLDQAGHFAGVLAVDGQGLDEMDLRILDCVVRKFGMRPSSSHGDGSAASSSAVQSRRGFSIVEALKPTGAGDSFMAGLMTAMAAGHAQVWETSFCTPGGQNE